MVQRLKQPVESILTRADQSDLNWGIISFYVGCLLFLGYLWTQARSFKGENLAPLVLYITAILCFVGILSHFLFAKGYVPNPFENEGVGSRDELDDIVEEDEGYEVEGEAIEDEEEFDNENEDRTAMTMVKTILSLILFPLLIPNIGFFSASFIFNYLVIYDRTRNGPKTLFAASLLVLVFYILFIEILGNYLLLRLGLIDQFIFEELIA